MFDEIGELFEPRYKEKNCFLILFTIFSIFSWGVYVEPPKQNQKATPYIVDDFGFFEDPVSKPYIRSACLDEDPDAAVDRSVVL